MLFYGAFCDSSLLADDLTLLIAIAVSGSAMETPQGRNKGALVRPPVSPGGVTVCAGEGSGGGFPVTG